MKKLLIIIIILGLIGYGGYRILLTFTANQVLDQVTNEILTDDVVEELMSNPEIVDKIKDLQKDYQTNEKNISENLPFHTKEEATKTLLSRFSLGEIRDISVKASRGLTLSEQAQLEKLVAERLTEEELEALLLIGLTEISEDMLDKFK